MTRPATLLISKQSFMCTLVCTCYSWIRLHLIMVISTRGANSVIDRAIIILNFSRTNHVTSWAGWCLWPDKQLRGVHDLKKRYCSDEANFVGPSREHRTVYGRQFARKRASGRFARWWVLIVKVNIVILIKSNIIISFMCEPQLYKLNFSILSVPLTVYHNMHIICYFREWL